MGKQEINRDQLPHYHPRLLPDGQTFLSSFTVNLMQSGFKVSDRELRQGASSVM